MEARIQQSIFVPRYYCLSCLSLLAVRMNTSSLLKWRYTKVNIKLASKTQSRQNNVIWYTSSHLQPCCYDCRTIYFHWQKLRLIVHIKICYTYCTQSSISNLLFTIFGGKLFYMCLAIKWATVKISSGIQRRADCLLPLCDCTQRFIIGNFKSTLLPLMLLIDMHCQHLH